jgi:hypothetical protein
MPKKDRLSEEGKNVRHKVLRILQDIGGSFDAYKNAESTLSKLDLQKLTPYERQKIRGYIDTQITKDLQKYEKWLKNPKEEFKFPERPYDGIRNPVDKFNEASLRGEQAIHFMYQYGDKLKAKEWAKRMADAFYIDNDSKSAGLNAESMYRAAGMDKESMKKRLETKRKQNLEGKTSGIIGIVGVLGGIFFLSSNLTGNVIGSLNQSSSNFIGIGFFLVGLVGAFFYFKKR